MKPVIGITTDVDKNDEHELPNSYVQAVIRAGGLPLILPIGIEEDVDQVLAMLDGLLLSGGNDINPLLFDEEPHAQLGTVSPSRDSIELALTKRMLELDKPILGICRGLQILNVACGGNLYQDIYKQNEGVIIQHMQKAPVTHASHVVDVEKGSLLATITEEVALKVNSYHHQSIKEVGKNLTVTGIATDGIIEAVESIDKKFVLGVQWHPEKMATNGDVVSLRILKKFIEACV